MWTITKRLLYTAIRSKPVCRSLNSTRALSSSSAIIKNPSYSRHSQLTSLPQQYLRPLGVRLFSSNYSPDFPNKNGRRAAFNWGLRIVPQQELFYFCHPILSQKA